jgi:tetratricopeptide (TPR) repeat protein
MAGSQEAYQNAMNQGHSAAWDQQWDKAAQFYREALEESPDDAAALNSLGMALYEMQKFEEALICYRRAAQLVNTDPLPFDKMARIFERQGKLTDAFQAYLKAADLYLSGRDVDKAIDCWNRSISLQPDSPMPYSRLGLVYEKLQRLPEAVSAQLSLASLTQRSGNAQQAMKIVEHTLQIQPENKEARLAMETLRNGQLLAKPMRPKGGTGPVRMAEVRQMHTEEENKAELDPITEARQKALVRMADLLFDTEEVTAMPESRSGGRKAAPRDPAAILLHLGQAVHAQTNNDNNQTVTELEAAVEAGLDDPAVYYDLGLLMGSREQDKALRYFQLAVQNPDFALAGYLLMGRTYFQKGDYIQAAVAYLRALSAADAEIVSIEQADELRQNYEPLVEETTSGASPDKMKNLCESINSQLTRPDWRAQLHMMRQQLGEQPPDAPPIPLAEIFMESGSNQMLGVLTQIRGLAARGLYRAAMEECLFMIGRSPGYLPFHIQIAELLIQQDRVDDAVKKFILVAELYNIRGETTPAIRLLNRTLQVAPMDMGVRNRLIDMLVAQNRIEEAIEQYVNLSNIQIQQAEYDQARQTYTSALRLLQQKRTDHVLSVQILYKVADLDLQRLELRQALRVFEQIRTLEPGEANARSQIVDIHFRLGQTQQAMTEVESFIVLLENSNKHATATRFMTDLVENWSDKLELRMRLADLYTHANQVSEAVQQYDYVADALLSSGNKQGAIRILLNIITLNPPNVADYRAALEQLRG